MRHVLALAGAATLLVAGCSTGDDDAATTDPPPPSAPAAPDSDPVGDGTESGTPDATVSDGTDDAEDTDDTDVAEVSVVVEAAGVSDDRTLARGAGQLVHQGQTFRLDEPSVLTSVSFTVVPADDVPAGQTLHLDLYGVADPVTLVPSRPIDVAAAGGGLDLEIAGELEAGVAVVMRFELPGTELVAGDYAAVLSIPDGAPSVEFFVQHAVSDEYPDGFAIWYEGSTWKVDRTTGDQAFALELLV